MYHVLIICVAAAHAPRVRFRLQFDHFGLELQGLRVKNPQLNGVFVVEAAGVSEVVQVLNLHRILYDGCYLIPRGNAIIWILVLANLGSRKVDSIDHGQVYELIAVNGLDDVGVHSLEEGGPHRHPKVSDEVLFFREHRHIVVQVYQGLGGHCRLDVHELLEPDELLLLRNHDICSLRRSSFHHALVRLGEHLMKLGLVIDLHDLYEAV